MKGWVAPVMSSFLLAPSETDAVQETLLGEALEHAPIAAIVLDETGRYLAANRMACRLTGYAREELLDAGVRALAAEPARDHQRTTCAPKQPRDRHLLRTGGRRNPD